MIKRNNLRKVYMLYSIALAEVFIVIMLICAGKILGGALLSYVRFGFAVMIAAVPVIVYMLYRWRGKDNAESSDELEQLVLTKAFAASGFMAVTLLPALLLFTCLFHHLVGLIVLIYAAAVGGTLKLSTLYYYNKY